MSGCGLIFMLTTAILWTNARATSCHSHPAQDDLERTKPREGRLHQVEPDKGGKPQPIRAVKMGQQQADEDETARESANNHFHKISGAQAANLFICQNLHIDI